MRKLALPLALVFGFALVGCSDDDSCVDMDGDGYGQGSGCRGEDCDDNDSQNWMAMDGYPDGDGDGENSATVANLCTDGTLPSGFSATAGTDCDDGDAQAVELVDAYVDGDGDGVGAGSMLSDVCGGPMYLPPGYAETGTDCEDGSALIWMEHSGYLDWDEDTVVSDTLTTICGTDTAPAELNAMAGTDCDDVDPYSTNDASHAVGCSIPGACGDTELALGTPDGRGVGGCATTDCNGLDDGCDTNPMVDSGTACPGGVGDCMGGQVCWSPTGAAPTCWSVPNCCVNDDMGLYCSEIIDCLTDCADLLPDNAAYVGCQQFNCFEAARPTAQELYRRGAECAAAAGCWGLQPEGAEAITACVSSNCIAEFAACYADEAP